MYGDRESLSGLSGMSMILMSGLEGLDVEMGRGSLGSMGS